MQEARELIEEMKDEEQEAFDNLPEGIQASEKVEMMENYISEMEDAISYLDDAVQSVENTIYQA
jgi:flagellar biosynthesis chaperone FliJ